MTEIKMKEAEKLQQECTFKPKLVTRNTSVHQSVQSKFTLPLAPKGEGEPSEMKHCTFTPKVGNIFHPITHLLVTRNQYRNVKS